MLAPSESWMAGHLEGPRTSCSSSRPPDAIACRSSAPSSSRPNSSPPNRAIVSPGAGRPRTAARPRSGAYRRHRARGCRCTPLKPSTSTMRTLNAPPSASRARWPGRAGARKSARFATPVRRVVVGLMDELLLEPHAFGDVAGVHHDAVNVAVPRGDRDVGREIAAAGRRSGDQRPRAAPESGPYGRREIVGMDEACVLITQHRIRVTPTMAVTTTSAPVLIEHEHEICRRRDDAPEMSGAAPGGRDEGEREEERHGEARDAGGDLPRSARSGCGRVRGDRAAFSETFGVRSERDRRRSIGSVVRTCRGRSARRSHGPAGQERASVAVRSRTNRSWSSSPRTDGTEPPERSCVVVPVHRARAPVEEYPGAAAQDVGRARRVVRLCAGADEQHLLHVALGERPLAGGDLEHRRAMLRSRRLPRWRVRRRSPTRAKRGQDRRHRATAEAGER